MNTPRSRSGDNIDDNSTWNASGRRWQRRSPKLRGSLPTSSATEAVSLKYRVTLGAAVQLAGATAGSPPLHSPIDLSAMLSTYSTPYIQKIAARHRLDDFDLLTQYLIVSSSSGHFLFPHLLAATMSFPHPPLSLRRAISFALWAILCVQQGG